MLFLAKKKIYTNKYIKKMIIELQMLVSIAQKTIIIII